MKLARTIALAGALLAAQSSFANGYVGNAWNGTGCTYPTSVVFTNNVAPVLGGSFDYDITTNGVTQTLHYYNEGAFYYALNCTLPYTKNQTLYFEVKGTNIFANLNHFGLQAKLNVPGPTSWLGEGPIFWGPNSEYKPASAPLTQIELFAFNWPGKTQDAWPADISPVSPPDLSAFPNGAPSLVDGVTYRVWVDANYDGTQIWVLDPSGNSAVPSSWLANIIKNWNPSQSVDPYQFGIGFFAIARDFLPFPYGAKLEFTNISVSN